jgi:hypothetical protein
MYFIQSEGTVTHSTFVSPETVKRRGERNLKKKVKRRSKSSMAENPGPGARRRSPKNPLPQKVNHDFRLIIDQLGHYYYAIPGDREIQIA